MKRTAIIFIPTALLALFLNCQGQGVAQHLSPETFQSKIEAKSEKIILDVRTPAEYNRGHLKDAVSVDYYAKDFKSKISLLDKSKPVFVYCAAGPRSQSASKILADIGFKEIYNLNGGINAWIKSNKPVEK
jgi:rhodanese-related sulfurtransferase